MATFETAYRHVARAVEVCAPAPLPRDTLEAPASAYTRPIRDEASVEGLRATWDVRHLDVVPQGCANVILTADWMLELGGSVTVVERALGGIVNGYPEKGVWRDALAQSLRHWSSPNTYGELALLVGLRLAFAEALRSHARGERRRHLPAWLRAVHGA